jgi:hypothetical protein
MATMQTHHPSASHDAGSSGYWPSRLVVNPWLWLGLADVALLTAAVVASLRHRYIADWRHAEVQLPDPRWIVALALVGLAIVLVKPGRWAVAASMVTLTSGIAMFIVAIAQQVVYVLPPTRRHPEPTVIPLRGWQEWIETPMRAEGLAAALFVSVALLGFVIVLVLNRGCGGGLTSDGRWWVAAGAFAIVVVAGVALLRLWQTQDTMHREIGSAGFIGLALVALAAFSVALVVLEQEAAWVAVITLGVAAALGWGPALAWVDQTKAWPGPALVHQSMVVEGLAALVLGSAALLAAVVCQIRDRSARTLD